MYIGDAKKRKKELEVLSALGGILILKIKEALEEYPMSLKKPSIHWQGIMRSTQDIHRFAAKLRREKI